MSRAKWTQAFLWLSVIASGIGLGAKLFDLVVVARAWGLAPPASLALLPYGGRFPVNPGDFFQPLSAALLIGVVGALISGWKSPPEYRMWLWSAVVAFVLIWIFTPTVFWPMINELYAVSRLRITKSDAELAQLVRRWMIWDSLRVVVIAIGFLSSIRAISIPYREATPREP